jgi:hypothetical protein
MWFSSWLGKRQRAARNGRSHGSSGKRPGYRPQLEALEDRWLPSQVGLTVTSLADSGPDTLRAAIVTADAGSHSDKFTIDFTVTGTIDLQTPLPELNNSIAIQGPGASSLTVERAAGFSFATAIVTVDAGQTASLAGLTVANGNAGGIVNNATLTVANSAVVNNTLVSGVTEGAGIDNDGGTLTVTNSAVLNNSIFNNPDGTFAIGGGIFSVFGALTISGSTVSGNSSQGCTLSGNTARAGGGGIFNGASATLTIDDSTVCDNFAALGADLYNLGVATINDSDVCAIGP